MIKQLIAMSNKYGLKPSFVLAGGGNTSYKDDIVLVVKASGYRLADITAAGFVSLNRHQLNAMWTKSYSLDVAERERDVLSDLMTARLPGETNRPSVETQLHDLFPFSYVLHLHPTKINGLTCSKHAQVWVRKNLSNKVLWIPATKPGYLLAMTCKEMMKKHEKDHGVFPQILLLENHGVFFAADTVEAIDTLVDDLMEKINLTIQSDIDLSETQLNHDLAYEVVKHIHAIDPEKFVVVEKNRAVDNILQHKEVYDDIKHPFTPDHVVYCRHQPLLTSLTALADDYHAYLQKNHFPPRIIFVKDIGMFAVGDSEKQTDNARLLFLDQIQIAHYSHFFSGPQPMTESDIEFILNWEVEHYRIKVQSK